MVFDKLINLPTDHPRLWKTIKIIFLLYSTATVLYTYIISGIHYNRYIRRDQYSVKNLSGKYYIYKTNLIDPMNCSNRSAFSSYPYSIYPILIWNHPLAIIFSISFWITTIFPLPLLLLQIRNYFFISEDNTPRITFHNSMAINYFIYTKSLNNFALIMMSFPLLVIDYSKLCIEYDSNMSLIIMSGLIMCPFGTFIAMPFLIFDMILVYRNSTITTYFRIISWATKKEKQNYASRCLVHYVVWFPFFYIIYIGGLIQISSLTITATRLLGILLTINILLTNN